MGAGRLAVLDCEAAVTDQQIIDLWRTPDAPDAAYFARAEQEDWLSEFWGDGPFLTAFETLDLSNVLEIACGHGRHSALIVDRCGHLHLQDTSEAALQFCRERFSDKSNITYHLGKTGRDLASIATENLTAVYCYDAAVHFDWRCVLAYLSEIYCVLRAGGRALLHHSVIEEPGTPLRQRPRWRNFLPRSLLLHEALRIGFRVESSEIVGAMDWPVTDGLTLLCKGMP